MTENSHKDAKAQLKAAKAYAKASRPWYKMKRTWLAIVVALIVLGAALSQGGGGTAADPGSASNPAAASAGNEASNEGAAEEKPKPLIVSANKMIGDLDSNALKASNTYKGKYVQVKGEVTNIDSSGNYFSVGRTDDEITFTTIRMDIEEEHRAKVAEFDGDQVVTVTGTVTDVGEVLGYTMDVESIS